MSDFATKLELLLAVSKYGSFAKASEQRNIDRSSMSKQIKQLEESLGVRLLNRTTRSLSLTNVGREIVEQAQKLSDLLDETKHIAETFTNEPKGHIRISSSSMFGRTYLQKAVKAFVNRYPKAHIELVLDEHRVDMVGERFDLVFRIGPVRDSSMIARKLAENRIALVASKEFVERYGNPQTPEELVKLPAIIYSNGNFIADKLSVFSGPGLDSPKDYGMSGQYVVNETELMLEAIKDGIGYGLVGHFMIPDDIESMGLVQLLPDYILPSHGDVYAMYSHRNQPPLVKLFLEVVQDVIGSPPIWEKNFCKK